MNSMFCWEKWGCMWVWGWIWVVSAVACGLTVVNAAIFAQASLSRLGESTRVLTTTRARLGDLSTFWATPCLAQARRSRLSEKSWKTHVARLAWARIREVVTLRVSPEREFEMRPCCSSRLSENSLPQEGQRLAWASSREGAMFPWLFEWFIVCTVQIILPKYDVHKYVWMFGLVYGYLSRTCKILVC